MIFFITGAAGFIGSGVARALLARGETVVGLDNFNDYYDPALKEARVAGLLRDFPERFLLERGSIADRGTVEGIFKKYSPKKVFHPAAQAGVRYSIENPHAYGESNLTGFLNVIEAARRNEVENFVYASSSSVYGDTKKLPSSVADRTDDPISLYAATKKSNELMAHAYAHLFGLPTTGLRYFTVYGPWGRPDMAYFSFTKKILAGETIPIFGEGKMRRNFTFIDDVIAATVAALDRPRNYGIFNIGNDKSVELLRFVEIIETACGIPAKKDFLPMQPGDVRDTVADISETRAALDFVPMTDIEIGLPRFVEWFREFYGV